MCTFRFEENRPGDSLEGVCCAVLRVLRQPAEQHSSKVEGRTLGMEITRLPEEQPGTVRARRVRLGHIFAESARS